MLIGKDKRPLSHFGIFVPKRPNYEINFEYRQIGHLEFSLIMVLEWTIYVLYSHWFTPGSCFLFPSPCLHEGEILTLFVLNHVSEMILISMNGWISDSISFSIRIMRRKPEKVVV